MLLKSSVLPKDFARTLTVSLLVRIALTVTYLFQRFLRFFVKIYSQPSSQHRADKYCIKIILKILIKYTGSEGCN